MFEAPATTPTQREYPVELPIGFADGDGSLHRRAAIRKMRGHEEALLYDQELSSGDLVSHLIAGTLVRLGTLDGPGPELIRRMYSADRNFLLLQIRRVTLGDDMAASYGCPSCGAEVRVVEDLGELGLQTLREGDDPEAIVLDLEDGYRDREGREHFQMTLRLPRGDDEVFVAPMVDRDPMKAADALTLRCIRSFGTLPAAELQAYGPKILRDLSLGDRLRIQRALSDDAPGASFRVSVRCGACTTRFERLLDVSDFFVPCWVEASGSDRRSSTWPITSTGPGATS